ncbi:hypothetical protein JHK87_043187 [Glycine soja]|nr:hypothetical protein JHK87_043187 [Glycine soja]
MKAWETTQDEMMIAGGLHVVVFNKMVVFTVFNHFKIDTFEASCLILWQVMVKCCPKIEQIVLKFVHDHIHNAPSLAAALIRMHFHDCFVRGCDASALLNSTTNQVEKNARPNLTVRGFDFIGIIKSLVEAECHGVVS